MATRRARRSCSGSTGARCTDASVDTPPRAASRGATTRAPTRTEPAPAMNSALLIGSVDALVSCRDAAELTNAVALLAQRLLVVSDACVLLRGSERESSNEHPA